MATYLSPMLRQPPVLLLHKHNNRNALFKHLLACRTNLSFLLQNIQLVVPETAIFKLMKNIAYFRAWPSTSRSESQVS